ncbi:IucA/IucC family protein [Amycolatopsis mediterranei S699]|uniref:IucA/IucC family protein n=2 Tax=Amycolatopsis mediterranei TaxID=33910 RepID=A0A0H3D0P6_AMYMU|nr:IucA/IucC family protein [Amycolatopsis mediterranei]ADJ44489.1 IucA/IucC family protein [Amycolatopsis mediterranei U32]AEK41227.1 IucA/IucC family protein [Amycolatopsis mediterranei S699]AFO76202.1 IucA/IucC family protein [Amycolatopsis mediterranei S699]AGT83331.1 IucA/IucC family protein [Amycolatopsis mediterranei RB]KDO07154.1 IucA/IucC family protein [Amycolatopsis mediterranei]
MTLDEAAAWRAAGALITHKMLGELSYEHMLEPVADGEEYRLELPGARYTFRARRGAFDAWTVEPGSARRSGEPVIDPRTLVVDARAVLGLSGLRLADVLAELTSTVANEAARLRRAPTAAELSTMDYDVADGHLTGHPRLVLNKGRVGFSARDRARYAPEAGADLRLRWFAVHPDHAEFRCVGELSRDALLAAELGEQREEFAAKAPEDYVWVPVHPWQADEILGTLYAAELATGVVIDLGESADAYRPHQTVRTLANVSTPGRHDVKTAVSVRNTLVYRGLNSAATLAGPSVTTWLRRIGAGDPLLTETYRFGLLGEVASVSVRHPLFGHLEELPYRFHETLGALWREPIRLAAGERAISFAALPYRGPDGVSMLAHLIGGGDVTSWLTRLFDLLLTPLLQWLLRHGVGFCPHGQNLVLVVDTAGVPQRVLIKDFAQGVDLLDEPLESYESLPPEAAADMLRWPAHLLAQSLFSSVFSGQFRFWAEVLLDELGLPRAAFWAPVREIAGRYREENPDVAARFDACRLFAPGVERVTLNREHFAGQGFDKVERDDEFDVRWGRVPNPLHAPDPGGAW